MAAILYLASPSHLLSPLAGMHENSRGRWPVRVLVKVLIPVMDGAHVDALEGQPAAVRFVLTPELGREVEGHNVPVLPEPNRGFGEQVGPFVPVVFRREDNTPSGNGVVADLNDFVVAQLRGPAVNSGPGFGIRFVQAAADRGLEPQDALLPRELGLEGATLGTSWVDKAS